MADEITTLELGNQTAMSYRIHPSVTLQIMDFYYRKSNELVVGTLLGHVDYTHIDITNCYAVPLIDNQQQDDAEEQRKPELNVDKEYNKKMFDLNHKIYPNEVVVGFFSNFKEMNFENLPIYQFYSSKDSQFKPKQNFLNHPLAILFDPLSKSTTFQLKAFINQPLHFAKDVFAMFQQVNLTYDFFNDNKNEAAPFWIESKVTDGQKTNHFGVVNLENLESQIQETLSNIKVIEDYVAQVKSGKQVADEEIGKSIKKLLGMSPSIDEGQFKKILESYKQDIIMLMYLSNLAGAQNLLSEKLGKIL